MVSNSCQKRSKVKVSKGPYRDSKDQTFRRAESHKSTPVPSLSIKGTLGVPASVSRQGPSSPSHDSSLPSYKKIRESFNRTFDFTLDGSRPV